MREGEFEVTVVTSNPDDGPVDDGPVPSALPSKFRYSAGFMLSKAAHIVQIAFEAGLKPFGVSAREFAVMQLIDLQGPASQQQIGRVLGIDRTSMVSLIDHLERTGMAARVKDPADRRRYAVSLSTDGAQRLHDDLYRVDREVTEWFLEGIIQADSDHLLETLERLIESR